MGGGGYSCPECEKSFPTERGAKSHFGQVHNGSIAGVEKICEACGDTFSVPPGRADTAKYCSKKCLHGPKPIVECAWCSDEFSVDSHRAEVSERHFCSHDCHAKWMSQNWSGGNSPLWKGRVEEECANCGATVFRRPSHPDVERHFCSQRCYGEWASENRIGPAHPDWEGGEVPYGEGWNETKKEAVRDRDGRECQHCGRSEGRHNELFGSKHVVHHIIPAREIGDPGERNAMDNLITLCRGECHQVWEQMAPLRPDVAGVAD